MEIRTSDGNTSGAVTQAYANSTIWIRVLTSDGNDVLAAGPAVPHPPGGRSIDAREPFGDDLNGVYVK